MTEKIQKACAPLRDMQGPINVTNQDYQACLAAHIEDGKKYYASQKLYNKLHYIP